MRACLVVAALNFWAFSAEGATPPPAPAGGDAEAQKLVTAAMEVDYLKMNFDAAKKKLSQAALICRRKGCATGLHASIHGYFAVIHWMGEDSKEFAHEDLKNMLKIDVEQKLDARYSNEELDEAWEAKQVEMRKVVAEEKRAQAAREAEERKAQATREAEERRLAAVKAAQDAAKAEEERKAAALKAEQDRKEAARKAEEDKKIAFAKLVEERKAAAAKQAEVNKQQAIKEAEEKLARGRGAKGGSREEGGR
jgi:flagellar biosynthesis GTPase FlhF